MSFKGDVWIRHLLLLIKHTSSPQTSFKSRARVDSGICDGITRAHVHTDAHHCMAEGRKENSLMYQWEPGHVTRTVQLICNDKKILGTTTILFSCCGGILLVGKGEGQLGVCLPSV